jgi:maltooligosyltrehalose trehalohydrolase
MAWQPTLGAIHRRGATQFRLWAPDARAISLVSEDATHAMHPADAGSWTLELPLLPGALYRYLVDGHGPFPDPASRYQPLGVHGPSAVVDPAHPWTDAAWPGPDPARLIVYELHIGAFTPQGTFAAAAERLPYLRDLGITAVELMPVADFPGDRNWGYDGVALFAPARCYGTPRDLRAFVDRAHALGLAVFLDAVYNHFGPDGAYQGSFARDYYSPRHKSPWGDGINFDGPGSEGVRRYVIDNACHWIAEYHMDGLRLDATHAIVDDSPVHILAEIAGALRGFPKRPLAIAEDGRNSRRLLTPPQDGGYGLDAVWADDFHHHTRVRLAGDTDSFFADYDGSTPSLARTLRDGWFYSGQHSACRGGPRGTTTEGLERHRFIVCIQNHDQIGNRAFGDRLHHSVSEDAWRAASAMLLLAPETPLLFMGQEWAASTPFQFFTCHRDELGRAVTAGRRREFRRFRAFADPVIRETIPDPQSPATFERSRLRWDELAHPAHAPMLDYYRRLIAIRKKLAAPMSARVIDTHTLALESPSHLALIRFDTAGDVPLPPGAWASLLLSSPCIHAAASTVTFPVPGAAVLVSGSMP